MKQVYTCGPTTYAPAHLGNLRAMVFADNEVKKLEKDNVVQWVMNITDIDDKILDACGVGSETWMSPVELAKIREFTEPHNQKFKRDLEEIGVDTTRITFVRASDHMALMYEAYKMLKLTDLDVPFTIWKTEKNRPGWHLECASMMLATTQSTIDLHTGGIDLKHPHHENERILYEALRDHPMCKEYKYCNYLTSNGKKMSKSLGNYYTLDNIKEKGYNGSDLRKYFDNSNPKRVLDFSFEKLGKVV